MDNRVFKGHEIGLSSRKWVADLNKTDQKTVNPDMYYKFESRREAITFLHYIDKGFDAHQAKNILQQLKLRNKQERNKQE